MAIGKFSGIGKEGIIGNLLRNPGAYGYSTRKFYTPATSQKATELWDIRDWFSYAERVSMTDAGTTMHFIFTLRTEQLGDDPKYICYGYNGGSQTCVVKTGPPCSLIQHAYHLKAKAHMYRTIEISTGSWSGFCAPGWHATAGLVLYIEP